MYCIFRVSRNSFVNTVVLIYCICFDLLKGNEKIKVIIFTQGLGLLSTERALLSVPSLKKLYVTEKFAIKSE